MGFRNAEIASQLVLAESTVKSHLTTPFAKLGVRSCSEATELILRTEAGLGRGIMSLDVEPLSAQAVHDVELES